MDTITKYQQELNKIIHLKDLRKETFRFSSILLFREYQSRLFKWKMALDLDRFGLFNKNKQFHNLFIDLSPTWLDEIISEKKVVEDLNALGFDHLASTFRHYDGFFISMFLNWEIFKDKPEIQIHGDLLPPYEPAFKIFSRGGSIVNVELLFKIDGGATYRTHDNTFKLPSLSDDFLAYIDESVIDFPNQELVNELWEKFKSNNSKLL